METMQEIAGYLSDSHTRSDNEEGNKMYQSQQRVYLKEYL